MKKLFLCLVTVVVSFTGFSVWGNDITLYDNGTYSIKINGEASGYTVYNDKVGEGEKKLDFFGYAEVHFRAEAKINEDNVIGVYVESESNPNNTRKFDFFEEIYLYNEGNYGRFEFGLAKNIANKIHVHAVDVGVLDIDSSYALNYVYLPSDFAYISSTAITSNIRSSKLNYISPSFYGFQIAGSYIFGDDDTSIYNTIDLDDDKFDNAFTLALKYSYEDFVFTLSGANFENLYTPSSQSEKRNELAVGTSYYVRGLQLSAAYKRIYEKHIRGSKTQEGYAYNYGVAYEFGPVEFSLSNHHSTAGGEVLNPDKDTLDLTLLSGKYAMYKNLDFTTSFGRIAYDKESQDSYVGLLIATGFMIDF